MTGSLADALIRELSGQIGLEAVDAHRSAFAALACSQGWTKARVGRWLGISRARVGQKVDKLLHYATTRDDVPRLTTVMREAARRPGVAAPADDVAAWTLEDWSDLGFARQLIDRVDRPIDAAA